ncbi:CocE/NonD family hydrolase [Arthrobacter sp. NPDC090010]|uniref:CocE/NonD family hydrolase n=1 Tax=Arthrobacter sp. NPDC090010 TaxID=3363942 RepID=UPI00382B2C8A
MTVTLDDGCRLAADYFPAGEAGSEARKEGSPGTVLIRTPYGKADYGPQAESWNRAGFDVVVQDVRGRYGSSGDWIPYATEGDDGTATVQDLEARGLLHGPLLLAGASYDAHCALETARVLETVRALETPEGSPPGLARPTAVVAMVPALGLFETAYDPQGNPRFRDRIGWWHQHGFGRESGPGLSGPELDGLVARAGQDGPLGLMDDAVHGPGVHGPGAAAAWHRLWEAPPLDLHARYGHLGTPLLVIGGRKDFFAEETIRLADAWAQGRTELLWGPWGHRLAKDLGPQEARALRDQGGLLGCIRDWARTLPDVPMTREFTETRPGHFAWRRTERARLRHEPESHASQASLDTPHESRTS